MLEKWEIVPTPQVEPVMIVTDFKIRCQRMRMEKRDCDYYKKNISVVICNTDIQLQLTKS